MKIVKKKKKKSLNKPKEKRKEIDIIFKLKNFENAQWI